MAYLGNRNATGENNSFKILDDLAFTTTFNGSSAMLLITLQIQLQLTIIDF